MKFPFASNNRALKATACPGSDETLVGKHLNSGGSTLRTRRT